MILADTDVLIDFLAGIRPIVDQITIYAESGRLQTSAVTGFELQSGMRAGKHAEKIRRLLAAIPVLPLDRVASEQGARVHRELLRAGQTIGMGDSLIAGIALANDLPLFTRNRKHFERVQGLHLVDTQIS